MEKYSEFRGFPDRKRNLTRYVFDTDKLRKQAPQMVSLNMEEKE